MSLRLLPLLFVATGGCAAAPPGGAGGTAAAGETPAPVREGDEPACDAARAMHLVGRRQSEEVAAEALRLSGARALRWIRPGTAVTMDYRSDRLNIDLAGDGKVTNIRCG